MTSLPYKLAFWRGALTTATNLANRVPASLRTAMGREAKTQAWQGAALLGAIQGGLGAYTAGEGHRLEGFGRGAAQGALIGAGSGAVSGALTPVATAGRLKAMQAMGMNRADAARTIRNSWSQNVRHAWNGKGPAGSRLAAGFEAAAAPAGLFAAGEIGNAVLPASLMGGGEPAPQAQAPQAPPQAPMPAAPPYPPQGMTRTASDSSEDFSVDPLYVTPFTGTIGAGLADAAATEFFPNAARGFLRNRGIPALGAAALTIPAVKAIRALNPEPDPLKDIDVDALKTYFGKQRS